MSEKEYRELSYKPVLTYEKDINTIAIDNDIVKEMIDERNSENSTAYIQLSENRASSSIDSLNTLLENVVAYISIVTPKIQAIVTNGITFNDYKNALANGDESVTQPFLEYHRVNILGETGVEVYTKMYKLKIEATDLKALASSIIYGNDGISYEDAMAVEQLKFNKILEYENSGKGNCINYATLVTDTMINYVLKSHVDILNEYANGLFSISIATDSGDTVPVRDGTRATVEGFFKDACSTNGNDIYNLDTLLEPNTIEESVKTTFLQRQGIIEAINLQYDLSTMPNIDYTDVFQSRIDDAIDNSFRKILDFNKNVQQSDMYRVDYVSTLKQKDDIRRIYKSFK